MNKGLQAQGGAILQPSPAQLFGSRLEGARAKQQSGRVGRAEGGSPRHLDLVFFLSRSRLQFPFETPLITRRRQEVAMGHPLPFHPASACVSTR